MSRCTSHAPIPSSWLASYNDAQRRMKAGERQRRCPVCDLWIWPDDPSLVRPIVAVEP